MFSNFIVHRNLLGIILNSDLDSVYLQWGQRTHIGSQVLIQDHILSARGLLISSEPSSLTFSYDVFPCEIYFLLEYVGSAQFIDFLIFILDIMAWGLIMSMNAIMNEGLTSTLELVSKVFKFITVQ